jgi:hypothetical protein
MCLWALRFIGILERAKFPADELQPTSRDLDFAFDFYSTTGTQQRVGEFAAELEALSKVADQLTQAMKQMSGRVRTSTAYESYQLAKPLSAFSVRTKLILKNLPPDKGGPARQTTRQNLIFNVAIVWRTAFAVEKPLIRNSAGEYSGPLLDFVQKVLRFEGVNIHSKNELGKQLYEMRTTLGNGKAGPPCSLIDEKAQHARSRNRPDKGQ